MNSLFDKWWKKYGNHCDSAFTRNEVAKDAFKAGMLAAAEIVGTRGVMIGGAIDPDITKAEIRKAAEGE